MPRELPLPTLDSGILLCRKLSNEFDSNSRRCFLQYLFILQSDCWMNRGRGGKMKVLFGGDWRSSTEVKSERRWRVSKDAFPGRGWSWIFLTTSHLIFIDFRNGKGAGGEGGKSQSAKSIKWWNEIRFFSFRRPLVISCRSLLPLLRSSRNLWGGAKFLRIFFPPSIFFFLSDSTSRPQHMYVLFRRNERKKRNLLSSSDKFKKT